MEKPLETIMKEQKPAIVVDDDRDVDGGKNADRACCFDKAMELITQRDGQYKIAYLDVMLPRNEEDTNTRPYGIDIARYLSENCPETKVVIISGTHQNIDGLEGIPKWEVEEHLENYL